jgi:MFS transporter, FHS family, L-fucose permease
VTSVPAAAPAEMKTNHLMVWLVILIFFVISLLTNIIGPLVPELISSFNLSLGMAGFLPFAFFIAYGPMSIPSGMLVERYREKAVIAVAFAVAAVGALWFALSPSFAVAVPSFFLIGIGMAMLQVAINPLLRVAGGDKHFAFYSVLAQLIFGLASFISPRVYSYLVGQLTNYQGGGNAIVDALSRVVPKSLPWTSLYWVFAVVSALMVVVALVVRFPKVELKEEEKAGAWATHLELLKNPHVRLYFLGIFSYVGYEQGTANWISQFLHTYHGIDPQTRGAQATGDFWLYLTVGCVLGLLLLKLFDSRKVLVAASLAAIVTLAVALFGPGSVAVYAFPFLGFCASVMWSIIFALALNSVPMHHGTLSGILCTGIIGGAVAPFVIGKLGDAVGLRNAMLFLYVPLAYILSIGIWARPLVNNETLSSKKAAA